MSLNVALFIYKWKYGICQIEQIVRSSKLCAFRNNGDGIWNSLNKNQQHFDINEEIPIVPKILVLRTGYFPPQICQEPP